MFAFAEIDHQIQNALCHKLSWKVLVLADASIKVQLFVLGKGVLFHQLAVVDRVLTKIAQHASHRSDLVMKHAFVFVKKQHHVEL